MKRAALLLLAALALAGCGGDETGEEAVPAAGTTAAASDSIVDLENVLGLAADFRADEGKTRVLIILSPT